MRAAPYTQSDMERALVDAGLQAGDTVFFTTSLGMLGMPAELELEDGDGLNRRCLAAIRAVLGPLGTALVPTYSYTFGKSTASEPAEFDPDTTPAEIGPFPEFFRRQPGVVRSLDPMMSVAGQGPRAAGLLEGLASTSYGAGGVFARLLGQGVKCCSIGLGPNWMPFIHHADWLARVPYRYDKLFRGRLRRGGQSADATWLYSVLIQHPVARASAHALARQAEAAGLWRHAPLGRARVYVADYDAYFAFTRSVQARDPWATAEGPAGDVLALEAERVPAPPLPDVPPDADLTAILAAFAPLVRAEVSDAASALIRALALRFGGQILSWRTGENHFDWVVPERWRVRSASVTLEDGTPVLPEVAWSERVYLHGLAVQGCFAPQDWRPHFRVAGEGETFSVALNRDWGFVLRPDERARLPDASLLIHIDTAFAQGEMHGAQIGQPPASGPWWLVVVSVLGPAGREGLNHVEKAHQAYLRNNTVGAPGQGVLLLVSSPAAVAAWLDGQRGALSRLVKASVVDGGSGEGACGFPPGGNPVATEALADLKLPWVAYGKMFSADVALQGDGRVAR